MSRFAAGIWKGRIEVGIGAKAVRVTGKVQSLRLGDDSVPRRRASERVGAPLEAGRFHGVPLTLIVVRRLRVPLSAILEPVADLSQSQSRLLGQVLLLLRSGVSVAGVRRFQHVPTL